MCSSVNFRMPERSLQGNKYILALQHKLRHALAETHCARVVRPGAGVVHLAHDRDLVVLDVRERSGHERPVRGHDCHALCGLQLPLAVRGLPVHLCPGGCGKLGTQVHLGEQTSGELDRIEANIGRARPPHAILQAHAGELRAASAVDRLLCRVPHRSVPGERPPGWPGSPSPGAAPASRPAHRRRRLSAHSPAKTVMPGNTGLACIQTVHAAQQPQCNNARQCADMQESHTIRWHAA